MSIAPNRNKLPHYVHLAGTGCTHLLALYWLMVFIHETHVMPSSGKVKTKQEKITTLRGTGTGCTHLLALYWLMVFIHETQVMPSSGKVKTIRHLFSYLVIAGSECCPMRQLLQTLTNYVNLAGTGCTHLLTLYWLMVFIHETHVKPSSGKVKTKRHLFSYLSLAGNECCPMCKLLQTGTNYHITWYWY